MPQSFTQPQPPPPVAEPAEAARASGLRYVTDAVPGITRRRAGRNFTYLDRDGRPIRDPETLARIRSLAIPPAWTAVWISPHPNGHIQATGRDAKGRKQYRYHPRWNEARGETKFHRMIAFGEALPRIRRRIDADLLLPGLPREKVLAAVLRLLERTCIRIGNEEYARTNNSYGLTTMRDEHVAFSRARIMFRFRGKSGLDHEIEFSDPRLARIVRQCQDLPGQDLFQYIDGEGRQRTVTSADVNDYLREIAGQEFTSKDFRTWAGTIEAALALQSVGPFTSQREAKLKVVEAVRQASDRLRNRPATCRKHYIHPAVIDAYMEGLPLAIARNGTIEACQAVGRLDGKTLRQIELALLKFLKQQARAGDRLEEKLKESIGNPKSEIRNPKQITIPK